MAVALTVVLLALVAYEWAVVVPRMVATPGTIGVDFHQYQAHARRWLAGDGFYLPQQLAGPYHVWDLLPPLYPPTILVLLVPFLWLPEALWWAIPLAVIGWTIARHRPAPWTWPLLALCLAWPRTWELVLFGNPAIWAAAFAAAGTVWGWPAVGVLLKPTLAPFALIGVRTRGWWIALAVAAAVSALFLPMWLDYARVVLNADEGWTYSLRDVPLVALPVIAWLGRTTARR